LGDNGCFCSSTCPELNEDVAQEQASIIEKAIGDEFKKKQAASTQQLEVSYHKLMVYSSTLT
jgi:hypothetical protein